MYSLKPIVTEFEVDRPKNMYVIKEINPRTDNFLTNLENSLNVNRVRWTILLGLILLIN